MTIHDQTVSPPTGPASLSIPSIRKLFKGRVIAPDEDGYDRARALFYGGFDHRPALIVRVADTDDVARVIALARQSGLDLAVRSGGHSVLGHSVADRGIVLDLSDLRSLHIDPAQRSAWAETGLTAGEYTTAAGEHGLATGFGDTGSVGIGGLTLGGGIGYLVRKHGLTIDDLLSAELVTAAGELLRVDSESHPDLFWAIRGGGGNFGVATRFRFRLHPLESAFGGMLILPATPDTIAGFIDAAHAAPDELSTIANVMTAPPMPFLPPEIHGQVIVLAMLVYAGDPAAGEAAIAPFRKLAAPLVDMLKPMRYPEIYPAEEGGGDYHPLAVGRNMFVDSIDRSVAGMILDHLRRGTGSMAVAQIRVLGGAMARVPVDATAFAHRGSRIMAHLAALYERPEEKPVHEDWVSEFSAALQQSDHGSYVNFLTGQGENALKAAYPAPTLDRLRQVKQRYDPANLFHLNQNIPPAP